MGIYEAFDPVEAPVKAAAAPPVHGFGMDTLAAGWKAGQAGTDWGWHQANYESEIRDQLEDELRTRGREVPHYDAVAALTGRRLKAAGAEIDSLTKSRMDDADRFWGVVAEEKKRDPHFAKQFDGLDDVESVGRAALARRKKDEDAGNAVYARSTGMGKVAWWLGNLGTGTTDPLTYIPLTGGVTKAATVTGRIFNTALREAGVNAVAQLALEPLIQIDASARGQERGFGDVATDVALAGTLGGALGGGQAGLAEIFSRPREGRTVLQAAVEAIGSDNLTPDEKAAVAVVTRELDIKESSPFVPSPEGDKAHGTRLATAMASLEADQPVPDFKARMRSGTALGTEGNAIAQFKAMVRTVESGGDDAAKNPLSSATGRYQFTDSTWLQYYKRTFPANGLSNDQILAKRSDGAVQERLMDALTLDNAKLLSAAGQETTPGNLYLVHFLGPRATKVLKASDDVPVESLLPADFISSNPSVLRGKTAGEVAAWADRKMGGEGAVIRRSEDVATLNPDLFDDPEAYRLAQADDGPDESPFSFSEGGDQRTAGGIVSPEVVAERSSIGARLRSFAERFIPDRSGKMEPIDLAPVSPETAERISAVIGVDATGFVHAADSGAVRHWWQRHGPNGSKLSANSRAMSFEDLELIPEILASPDVVRQGRGSSAKGRTPTIQYEKRIGDDFFYVEEVRKPPGKLAFKTFYARKASVPRGGEPTPQTPKALAGQGDIPQTASEIQTARVAETSSRVGIPERVVQEAEASQRFTKPLDADAKVQTDSIIHDLTADALNGEDIGSYRLGDEGAEVTLDDVLRQVEADEAAIAAARNCL